MTSCLKLKIILHLNLEKLIFWGLSTLHSVYLEI